MLLLFLKLAAGLQGVLQTFAPRVWAICMMVCSIVVPPGAMRERNRESPMPLNAKFDPLFPRPMPLFVEKNMSAWAVVHKPSQADEAPKPSIRWKTTLLSTVQAPLVGSGGPVN